MNDRAENLDLKVDVVTARAFAPLPRLFGFAHTFFKNGADGWFLKGKVWTRSWRKLANSGVLR
ncbi:MAG: hypothetical protein WDN06_07325 [Asticcacaulis sp.]